MFCRPNMRSLGIAVVGVCLLTRFATGDSRPNVLLLVSDDQRPDTIHSLGNEVIETPNLDRLVREGTTFTRAMTAVPICVASRAEILTGRDGLFNGLNDHGFGVTPGVPHWAQVMRDAGYDTCYVGKWHTTGRPSDSGYARVEGLYAGGGGRFPLSCTVDWKGMPVTGYRGWVFQTDDGQLFPERGVGLTPDISAVIANAAIEFLQQVREVPFFVHVNFTAPHDPLLWPPAGSKRYDPDKIPLPPNFAERHPFDHGNFEGRDEQLFHWPRTSEETQGALAVYDSVITHLDAQLERLLQTLSQTGLLENTLVIWTSDHGLALGSHGLRGKQNMYEHSIGVPLIFRGPGITAGRSVSAQCYLRDLYPTACELCGIEVPPSVQGKSLRPVLDGEQADLYDAVFAHFRDSQRMVRTQDWKYIVYPQVQREQLFHLSDDPDELYDVSDSDTHAANKHDLQVRLTNWRREHNDPTLPSETR